MDYYYPNQPSKRTAIVISIEYILNEVKELFRSELPSAWFDNNEIDEIILRIFNIIISNIFNDITEKDSKRYETGYQSTLDYLMYCGVSQQTAFRIVHFTEMNILRTIFNTYSNIDNREQIKILEFHFFNKTNLLIIANVKEHASTPNHPYYQNTGLV